MKKSTAEIPHKLIREIEQRLQRYKASCDGMTWRDKVLSLVEIEKPFRKLGRHAAPHVPSQRSRENIRLYLAAHVGVPISSAELRIVSGISEFGRRARELRVEDGYKIVTGRTLSTETADGAVQLRPSEYLLLDAVPDHTAARRWKLANRIRRESKGGAPARILAYFKENVGQVVTTEELFYVAKTTEFARRIRELRTEQGYAICTKFTGRPDLSMAEYVLESVERVSEPHDRRIPLEVQKDVYLRDGHACRLCGWSRELWTKDDPRILELHHVEEHAKGGRNSMENLITLCSRCHDELHAGRLFLPPNIGG